MIQENDQRNTVEDELNIPISRPLPRKDTLVRNGTHLGRSGREQRGTRRSRLEWPLQGWLTRGAGVPLGQGTGAGKAWDYRRNMRKEAVTGPRWRKGAIMHPVGARADDLPRRLLGHRVRRRAVPARLKMGWLAKAWARAGVCQARGRLSLRLAASAVSQPVAGASVLELTSSAAAAESSGRRRRLGTSWLGGSLFGSRVTCTFSVLEVPTPRSDSADGILSPFGTTAPFGRTFCLRAR